MPVDTSILAHYTFQGQTRRSSTNIKQNAHIRVKGLANGIEEPSVRVELLLVLFFEHKDHLDRCNTACDIAHFVLARNSALVCLFTKETDHNDLARVLKQALRAAHLISYRRDAYFKDVRRNRFAHDFIFRYTFLINTIKTQHPTRKLNAFLVTSQIKTYLSIFG